MKNTRAPKFDQHLLMFGNVLEPTVIDWFSKSFIIEHHVEDLSRKSELFQICKVVSYGTGTPYKKVTEVIAGNKKGREFAAMSGSYPVMVDIISPQSKALLTKLHNFLRSIEEVDQAWEFLDEGMIELLRMSKQLKRSPFISLYVNRVDMVHTFWDFELACNKFFKGNFHNLKV